MKFSQRINNNRAMLCMFLGMFFFSIADAQSKFLTGSLPAIQIAWARQLVLFSCVFVFIVLRGIKVLETKHPYLQISRGATVAFSATFFTLGLSYVPLADAISITFLAPVIVTVLSIYLLGESVGKRRWIAVLTGLLGTLIITQPSFNNFNLGFIFPILAAMFFALRQVLSRRVSEYDAIQTTVAYTALISFALLSLCLPFFWIEVPSTSDATTLLSLSVFSAAGEILIIYAFSIGLAVVITPIHYTIIIWAVIFGYFFFSESPAITTVLGAFVIIISGFYIAIREWQLSLKV